MFHCLPNSAWADWNFAEVAVQLGKMLEHPNQSQPNPGLRAHESHGDIMKSCKLCKSCTCMQSCLEIADGHGADLLQFVPLVLVQFLVKVVLG